MDFYGRLPLIVIRVFGQFKFCGTMCQVYGVIVSVVTITVSIFFVVVFCVASPYWEVVNRSFPEPFLVEKIRYCVGQHAFECEGSRNVIVPYFNELGFLRRGWEDW